MTTKPTIIRVDKYFRHSNADYAGNPLVEFIPELTRRDIAKLMTVPINATPEERSHTPDQRLTYTWRLMRYFVPLSDQIDRGVDLWSIIMEGYRARNPASQPTTEKFNALCEMIASGKLIPNKDVTALETPLSGATVGTPGCGKSRAYQSLLRHWEGQLMHHTENGGFYQALYIIVEAPDTDSYLSLLAEIHQKLMALTELAGLVVPLAKPRTRGDYENAIAILARKLNLGLLIVEEIQHIASGSRKIDKATMKFLTGFVNRIGIPVLVVGTWEATAILGTALRLIRRNSGRGSHRVRRMQSGTGWFAFLEGMFRYQWTTKRSNLTEAISELFYFHCQGIHDFAVKLFMLCQVEAIRSGKEEIDEKLIGVVVEKHWELVAPAARQLRQGRQEEDPIIWDIEPHDFASYFQALVAEFELVQSVYKSKRDKAFGRQAKIEGVADTLEDLGVTKQAAAQALAESLAAKQPDATAEELARTAVKNANKPPPRPRQSASDSHKAKLGAWIQTLHESDLRKITYLASEAGRSSADALLQTGHIFQFTIMDDGRLETGKP